MFAFILARRPSGLLWLALAIFLLACSSSSAGETDLRCEAGFSPCADQCVNLEEDDLHCGGCGMSCADGTSCMGGACSSLEPPCGFGLTACSGRCVDLEGDPMNCGRCGEVCTGGICSDGSCARPDPAACETGLTACGGLCVDPETDRVNCGGCGEACDPGALCYKGACVCPATHEACEDGCADLKSDRFNCGACGLVCDLLPNTKASAGCSSGRCEYACEEGFDSCDRNWRNGCETHIEGDPRNCGECRNDCGTKAGVAAATCASSTCRVTACVEGRADCDRHGENGCESDIWSDLRHCGGCKMDCDPRGPQVISAACRQGTCVLSCAEGYFDCDRRGSNGCESRVEGDRENCGQCGIVCPQYCKFGACDTVVSLATGDGFACVALQGGPVYCWGENLLGQLGIGVKSVREKTPLVVPGLGQVQQVAAGESFACALDAEGRVWCWGSNSQGQLGIGSEEASSSSPMEVVDLPERIGSIAAGYASACAIGEGGSLYCWGQNIRGSGREGEGNVPRRPLGIDGMGAIAHVSVGAMHTCAADTAGHAYCWGGNVYGALGNGSTAASAVPVLVQGVEGVEEVAAGALHTCFLLSSGEVRCAGLNDEGQLGNGTRANSSTPLKVSGSGRWVGIVAGNALSCGVKEEGGVWCWGRNDVARIGSHGASQTRPVLLDGIVEAVAVAGRHNSICALSQQGGVHCWGAGGTGVLGPDWPTAGSNSPQPIRIEFP